MARMHARRRGQSGSRRPLVSKAPEWVGLESDEIVETVGKLASQGRSSAEIGLILRDQYAVPNVRLEFHELYDRHGFRECATGLRVERSRAGGDVDASRLQTQEAEPARAQKREVLEEDGDLVALGDVLVQDADAAHEALVSFRGPGVREDGNHVRTTLGKVEQLLERASGDLDGVDRLLPAHVRDMADRRPLRGPEVQDVRVRLEGEHRGAALEERGELAPTGVPLAVLLVPLADEALAVHRHARDRVSRVQPLRVREDVGDVGPMDLRHDLRNARQLMCLGSLRRLDAP